MEEGIYRSNGINKTTGCHGQPQLSFKFGSDALWIGKG